ncbi:DUF3526 domain-containing protein [Lewinella sp. 4G2]|uniref:ABC transporter permease n=1 Tax=Lewinella sp. 4G2 TaxID=1803372 RepID=UPI0007B4DAEA|nr:DUF3526 domain-containing protein [Lewinella sp. 4G2]OAV45682.1 hypothetical protein A3850_014805 [Lewinella sp. 4G2]
MVRSPQLRLIARHTYRGIIDASVNRWLVGVFLALIATALFTAFFSYQQHQHEVEHYSTDVRERWENNPDKHPHRMAHYGYVAFRSKMPLSFFDRGLDSYLGNAVFLEAHRQNAVNFSSASQSSGLLRFGELSAGLVLQLLFPLLIFFWGFASVAEERKTGVTRLLLTQGARWGEVILGKALGIFGASLLVTLPALALTLVLLFLASTDGGLSASLVPFTLLALSYLAYTLIMSLLAVIVSALSDTPKTALLSLIGCWLLFVLVVPKLAQVTAQAIYPVPSKIEFDTAVEAAVLAQGDSHNPDDPHFNGLRDSLLAAYGVATTKELPFNYGGYLMREGERLSTEIYNSHQARLIDTYRQQNRVLKFVGLVNPYLAIKQLSMTLAGSDFATYQRFREETEAYRYNLAQTMNELQIEFISNTTTSSADKGATISQQYWRDFPPFEYGFLNNREMLTATAVSIVTLLAWLFGLVFGVAALAKTLKAY